LAKSAQKHNTANYELLMISNRGTQVWPTGSIFTECVDQYRFRFETQNNSSLSLAQMLKLVEDIGTEFSVSSIEILRQYGNAPAYSLAQGQ
jgi:isocitrate dehydrogenase